MSGSQLYLIDINAVYVKRFTINRLYNKANIQVQALLDKGLNSLKVYHTSCIEQYNLLYKVGREQEIICLYKEEAQLIDILFSSN